MTPKLSLQSSRLLQAALYYAITFALCIWVLSLPVYPSQDGPLHLYYVNALGHLLTGDSATYASLYQIKGFITPYSLYYYGLLGIGHYVGLEWADKIVVCIYIVGFAGSARFFLRTVQPSGTTVSFLVLPVLLNWPLLMGFLNYSLSTCLALTALAVWMRFRDRPRWPSAVLYVLLLAAMMVTHPVPWLFVVVFTAFDLAIEGLRRFKTHEHGKTMKLIDLGPGVLFAVSLLAVPYILHFHGMVQTLDAETQPHTPLARFLPAFALPAAARAASIARTLGIDVFGGPLAATRLYRMGIAALFFACCVACVLQLRDTWKMRRWTRADIWALFTMLALPCFFFLPDKIADHFYFMSRLGVLVYLSALAGASHRMSRRRSILVTATTFSYALACFALILAVEFISPAAKAIASLRRVPPANGEGMILQPQADLASRGLNYLPYYWAAASYFRQHNLTMYNTAWLGDPILLVGVREPSSVPHDLTFYEAVPRLGSPLLPTREATEAVLDKVNFILMMKNGAAPTELPFSSERTAIRQQPFAGSWQCLSGDGDGWYFCQKR